MERLTAMVKLLFLADRNQNVAATATDKGEER
jgi:hypothetical protein